jgi:hypothetical protein
MSTGSRKGSNFFGENGPVFGSDEASRKVRDAWKQETDPARRALRKQYPYSATWAEKHDGDILDKQERDLVDDGTNPTEPGREKSAAPEEVARVRQTRDDGQRFQRTDAKPRTTRLSTNIQSGSDLPEGEEIHQWNRSKRNGMY